MNNLFRTPVSLSKSPLQLTYDTKILPLGSCFSDNIARKMQEYFLPVTANPFGTLYNPISIRHHLDLDKCRQYDVVIVTFGTAWVYCDKNLITEEEYAKAPVCLNKDSSIYKYRTPLFLSVVDNCLKRPSADFYRYRLTVEDILTMWSPLLEASPGCRFIFTVSPIRHIKDGLHENQLSKAILLQAVDIITKEYKNTTYFPSYEIILDELRAYRFYAPDMFHPSEVAIDYIWDCVRLSFKAKPETHQSMDELHQLRLMLYHRPLHPDSEDYQTFRESLRGKVQEMQNKYPQLQPLKQIQL